MASTAPAAPAGASISTTTTTTTTSKPLARGTYAPPTPSDLRSPCPLINTLANHGFIPRSGRGVLSDDLRAAMDEVGLSYVLGSAFARPIYLPHTTSIPARSFLSRLYHLLRHPLATLFSRFGMRRPNQTDTQGRPVLDLDQLALHGAVEHDVSLTRLDIAEGDNLRKQPELITQLLAASSDGKTLSAKDLADFRRRRIEQQRAKGHALTYGKDEHRVACAEIALILDVFGDGERVACERVKAVFEEERLPVEEGWTRRKFWTYGFFGLFRRQTEVAKLIGVKVE